MLPCGHCAQSEALVPRVDDLYVPAEQGVGEVRALVGPQKVPGGHSVQSS